MALKEGSESFMEPARYVDLRSDTLTAPTPAMRAAMAEAEVGDDVLGEDPTVNALQEKFAILLEKEAAIFLPSGTMGNLIAILCHCAQRGEVALVGDTSHIRQREWDGASALGVPVHTIPFNADGTFDLDQMEEHVQSLFCIENTFNGSVLPLHFIDEVGARLSRRGVPLHMDGARLFNAVVQSGVPAARLVRDCASVSCCLSKGLGAPAGSLLAGSKELVARARQWRQRLGGAMRQTGVLAAAAAMALDTGVSRLADDHRRMARIASGVSSRHVTVSLGTNILMLGIHPRIGTARDFVHRVAKVTQSEVLALGSSVGIRCFAADERTVRLVTFNGVSDEDAEAARTKLLYLINLLNNYTDT